MLFCKQKERLTQYIYLLSSMHFPDFQFLKWKSLLRWFFLEHGSSTFFVWSVASYVVPALVVGKYVMTLSPLRRLRQPATRLSFSHFCLSVSTTFIVRAFVAEANPTQLLQFLSTFVISSHFFTWCSQFESLFAWYGFEQRSTSLQYLMNDTLNLT